MKKTRFTEEQIATSLGEADAKPVPVVAKEQRERSQNPRLAEASRQPRAERREAAATARARERAAQDDGRRPRSQDRRVEGHHPKNKVDARVRRQQVAYAEGRGLSRRRACALLSVAPSTFGYASRLATSEQPAMDAMRQVAWQYLRYGCRRIRIFLRHEGHVMSTDRAHRLWCQAGLQALRAVRAGSRARAERCPSVQVASVLPSSSARHPAQALNASVRCRIGRHLAVSVIARAL